MHTDPSDRVVVQEFGRALHAFGTQKGDTIVLGVSGGADSLAMLHLFHGLGSELALKLHVVHVNHRIRGKSADADAAFVTETCAAWGIACQLASVDVPALARQRKQSLEEAARQARYAALIEEAARVRAGWVAVAHNADDQAETIVMHFLRGSGMAGLRGMQAVQNFSLSRTRLIRPLLGIPRADIEAYCVAHSLKPRIDATNADTTYFRNRLRHEVLPLLAKLNPNLRDTLKRTASIMAADYDWFEQEVSREAARISRPSAPDRVVYDLVAWQAAPLALQRALVRHAVMNLQAHLRDLSLTQVEQAMQVARAGSVGAQATLPGGLMLRISYDALVIAPASASVERPDWPLLDRGEAIALTAPGTAMLANGWQFTLARYKGTRSGKAWKKLIEDQWAARLDLPVRAQGLAPLGIRTRRPGDRFQPQGVGGTQKLSDFMINEKIPAAWRDHIPVLVMGDAVAWVCGWRVDEQFIVTPATKEVWLAQFQKTQG